MCASVCSRKEDIEGPDHFLNKKEQMNLNVSRLPVKIGHARFSARNCAGSAKKVSGAIFLTPAGCLATLFFVSAFLRGRKSARIL